MANQSKPDFVISAVSTVWWLIDTVFAPKPDSLDKRLANTQKANANAAKKQNWDEV